MLLSQHGVDVQDWDVIKGSLLPYRVEFHPGEGGYFRAGVLLESSDAFNIMLSSHQLMLAGQWARTWEEFQSLLKVQLENGAACMVGISSHVLPSPGYDEKRKQRKANRRHAVVIYSQDNNGYNVLDPSGGIDRNQMHDFDRVKSHVIYSVLAEDLRQGLEAVGGPWKVGYLMKWDGKRNEEATDVLQASRNALDKFQEAVMNFRDVIASVVLQI